MWGEHQKFNPTLPMEDNWSSAQKCVLKVCLVPSVRGLAQEKPADGAVSGTQLERDG